MRVQEYREIKGISIPIKITNHKRSGHIRITMKEGYLSVYKPNFYPMYEVRKLITKHEETIYKSYLNMLQQIEKKKASTKQWITGDMVLYHGVHYQMIRETIHTGKERLEIKDHKIYCYLHEEREEQSKREVIVALLRYHLKEETKLLLSQRLPIWSKKMGLAYESVKVRYAKTRWGSCVASRKSLNFNALLAMFPQAVADAVMVHELAHLQEPNHGKTFWNLVYQYIPEYANCDQWLKEHREELKIE